jgi:hypothetical protein
VTLLDLNIYLAVLICWLHQFRLTSISREPISRWLMLRNCCFQRWNTLILQRYAVSAKRSLKRRFQIMLRVTRDSPRISVNCARYGKKSNRKKRARLKTFLSERLFSNSHRSYRRRGFIYQTRYKIYRKVIKETYLAEIEKKNTSFCLRICDVCHGYSSGDSSGSLYSMLCNRTLIDTRFNLIVHRGTCLSHRAA